jgi:hypothetical protein
MFAFVLFYWRELYDEVEKRQRNVKGERCDGKREEIKSVVRE